MDVLDFVIKPSHLQNKTQGINKWPFLKKR